MILSIFGGIRWRNEVRSRTTAPTIATPPTKITSNIDWSAVDADLSEALHAARNLVREQANDELGAWIDTLRTRVDEQFLPWYFDYWTQKQFGLKGIGYWIANRQLVERFIGEQPEMAERIMEDIQLEFAKRVLRPAIAQRQIESMTHAMMTLYIQSLQAHLQDIQVRYQIPRPQWEAYLADLATLAAQGGPDTFPLKWKTLTSAVAAPSIVVSVAAVSSVRQATHSVGTHFAARSAATGASKAAAATAAKSGAATGAKLGSKMLGPIILIGVIAWDVWDHNQSRNVNEPILRENLDDYLGLLHQSMLDDPTGGMMQVIQTIETGLVKQLNPPN